MLCRLLADHVGGVDRSPVDAAGWERILAVARAHGVAPLLYHRLAARHRLSCLPRSARDALRREYYTTAAHNTLLLRELQRVLTALETGDVPPTSPSLDESPRIPPSSFQSCRRRVPIVVLKGAALATTLYPNPALRPLHDLDLLVPRHRVPAVETSIRACGYEAYTPEPVPGLNRRLGHHVALRGGPHARVVIEVHWNLIGADADWRTPAMDWFWDHVEALPEEGTFLYRLAPTATFLYLAAHLVLQHGGARPRLLWLYDLHLVLTRWQRRLDWHDLVERASAFRWGAAVSAALRATHTCFGSPLPDGLLRRLDDVAAADSAATRYVRSRTASRQTRAARVWNRWRTLGWSARMHYAWSIPFPRPAYVRWRYEPEPAWLWPLYYPYRWLDMLRDALHTLLHDSS